MRRSAQTAVENAVNMVESARQWSLDDAAEQSEKGGVR
jgi:hypothetical protein